MFTHFRTQGFFLKKQDRGEANQIFTIFTKDFGKLKILGKAIRKIKSKLRQSAEIFYLSEIEFIQGKNYKILTDALAVEKFKNLRKNPQKLAIAYKIIEVADLFIAEEEKNDEIWRLINEVFGELNNPSLQFAGCNLQYYYFLWNFLSILGYKPELYFCCVCAKKLLPETFWFSPNEGGIVCWQCFKNFNGKDKKEAKEISVNAVKILRLLLKQDWKILKSLKISSDVLENIEKISSSYLKFLKTV